MTLLISSFIVLQVILFFLMTFHDWVHFPPLTDIRSLEKKSTVKGRLINSTLFALMVLIPLSITWVYKDCSMPFYQALTVFNFYFFLSVGTVFSWWVPYFLGSSLEHKENFSEYKNTHHFLPQRSDNVVPNTFHVIMHFFIWTCAVLAFIELF